ncbi:MAG: hypothetical protein B7Y84_00940 [Azorhizobium sp. 32-67-21]|nr:MAG: hypothetical protein B7Y84_00940 [Azorhizobium sp. 32-67-21]
MGDPVSIACVIGAGPAGLVAASRLAAAGWRVMVFDRMPSPARKLLMAGRGGLNLTHSEPLDTFLPRYRPQAPALEAAVRAFDPQALRAFAADLGEETFVGSSGRVFPRSFKASPLLRAWLRRLAGAGVTLHLRHHWTGWTDDGRLRFATPDGEVAVDADATILALGGASWPRLGSDGGWTALLEARGVPLAPFAPLAARLAAVPAKQSLSSRLRKGGGLLPAAAGLLREAGIPDASPEGLAARIKALPLRARGVAGLERAISSAGGIRWDALDADFMLKAIPGVFACGEMLDWEAPTGGYLLQASFATGWAAAGGVLSR